MEMKLTKWYAMTSHVIAYRTAELLFGMHTFNFNCFFDDLIGYSCKYAGYLDCWSGLFKEIHVFIWTNMYANEFKVLYN